VPVLGGLLVGSGWLVDDPVSADGTSHADRRRPTRLSPKNSTMRVATLAAMTRAAPTLTLLAVESPAPDVLTLGKTTGY
jgi:hypothetical protein